MCGCHVLARLSPWRRSPCSLGQFQASTRSRSAVTGQHSVSCTITRPMKESDLDNTSTTKKDKSVPNSPFYEIVDNLDSFTPSVIMKQLKGLCMLNLFVIMRREVGIRTRPLSGLFLSHLYQVCWADVELAILSLSTLFSHQSHALLNHVSLWNFLNSRVVKTFQPHVPASAWNLRNL